jgi:hypothetical protein
MQQKIKLRHFSPDCTPHKRKLSGLGMIVYAMFLRPETSIIFSLSPSQIVDKLSIDINNFNESMSDRMFYVLPFLLQRTLGSIYYSAKITSQIKASNAKFMECTYVILSAKLSCRIIDISALTKKGSCHKLIVLFPTCRKETTSYE